MHPYTDPLPHTHSTMSLVVCVCVCVPLPAFVRSLLSSRLPPPRSHPTGGDVVSCSDPTKETCCGDGNACLNEDDKLTGKTAQTCRGLEVAEGPSVYSAYWTNTADAWLSGAVINGKVWDGTTLDPTSPKGGFLKKGTQTAYCYPTPKDDAKIPCGPTAETACDKDSYCSDDQYVKVTC